MIACSNIKGQNYTNLNKRSTENAKWENLVSLHLHPGDTINVENTTLNLRGISSDSTVELLNQDNEHGVSDSKTAIRFTAYVNDNGQIPSPSLASVPLRKLPIQSPTLRITLY